MVCANIYGLCKTLLSKPTTKTIVDIGILAALGVVGLEELFLSSASGSVSKETIVPCISNVPLFSVYIKVWLTGREIIKSNGTYQLALFRQLSLFCRYKFSKLESYGNLSNAWMSKQAW